MFMGKKWQPLPPGVILSEMRDDSRPQLLFGPYAPPPLKRGDRAFCLFKDCDVVITSWTDARLPWPRCRPLEGRSHPWLLVEEELVRAVRNESATALAYWWGVSEGVVWRWRKALGRWPRRQTTFFFDTVARKAGSLDLLRLFCCAA
jgi:hypothetical protein